MKFALPALIFMLTTSPFVSGQNSAKIDYSVGGLHLGMTSAEVTAKLGPKYIEQINKKEVHPGEPWPSVVQRFNGQGYQDKEHDGYSLEYIDDKLVYIQHEFVWPSTTGSPNFGQTKADLLAKFGPPTRPFGSAPASGVGALWEWTSSGQIKTQRDACEPKIHSYFISALAALAYPEGATPGCGIVVQADIRGIAPQTSLFGEMSIVVVDEQKLYNGIMQGMKRMKQQNDDEANRAKQRKAPL